MHIEFKDLCNASKHMNMHISNAIKHKFMSLLPLLMCFSFPRILILLNSSMLLPLCPLSMSKTPILISLSQSLPKLSYLCTISPPLSSISIKGVLLIDAKECIWGRWLRLESCIFYGHHLIVGHHL